MALIDLEKSQQQTPLEDQTGEPRQLWLSLLSCLPFSRALAQLTPESHSPNPSDAALSSGFFPAPWLDAPAGGRSFDLPISRTPRLKSQSEGSAPEPSSPLWAPLRVARSPAAAELLSLAGGRDAVGAAPAAVPPVLDRRVPQAAAASLHGAAAAYVGGNSDPQKTLVLTKLFLQSRH